MLALTTPILTAIVEGGSFKGVFNVIENLSPSSLKFVEPLKGSELKKADQDFGIITDIVSMFLFIYKVRKFSDFVINYFFFKVINCH